jgi:hypothetical protein
MDDESNPDAREPQESRGGVLLMRTWNDGEAEMVRQILSTNEIPCQVVSDVPHSVFPLTVDGLGEVRILVSKPHLARAKELIAEYRREGFTLVDERVPNDDAPDPGHGDPGDDDAEG